MKRVIVYGALMVCLLASVASAQEPIKIGVILHMSGRLAAFGEITRQGIEIALDKINADGGIIGRPVMTVVKDSKGDPVVARTAFRTMVQKSGVPVVIGVMTDEVAIALSEEAQQLKVPLIVTGAHVQAITGEMCNRYTFRLCPSAYQLAKAGALLAGGTNAIKWAAVGSDRAGSTEMWDLVARLLTEVKPEASLNTAEAVVAAPEVTEDWTPFLERIDAMGADGIFVYLPSGSFIDFVKAANRIGFFEKKRQMVAMMGGLSELLSLGTSMPPGVWWASPYWYQASRSPVNRRFVQAYESAFAVPPSWQAQFGYAAVIAFAEAVRKSGSVEPENVVRSLKGLKLELPVGPVHIRAEDHQAIMHLMAGKTARMSVTTRKKSFRGMGTMIMYRSKEISAPIEESACQMQ